MHLDLISCNQNSSVHAQVSTTCQGNNKSWIKDDTKKYKQEVFN